MTPEQGSVLSQYYKQQGKRIPGYQGNVSDMRTTAPDGRSAYVDDYGNMYYMDTGELVETRAIPEDLSQPMVGSNSAYGPYYEFGSNGPYDTRNINDPRHPDNPNNRPQVDAENGGYPAPTQAELREMMQQAQALREPNEARTAAAEADIVAANYQDYPHLGGVGPIRPDYDPSLDPDYDPSYDPYQHLGYGLGDLEDQIGYDPSPRPQVAPNEPRPQVAPNEPYPQVTPLPQAPTQSAGYLKSTGEGGYGAQAYYDEINSYLANHSQDEIQQAMGTYGVSQEDIDAARAYQTPQPQYARGGLSRMLRKVR